MNRGKKLFLLANGLLLIIALFAGLYAHNAAGRLFARDVIYIAPMLHEDRLFFSQSEFDTARDAFPLYDFAPEIRGSRLLSATGQQAQATVIYTDANYFSIVFTDFIMGNYWLSRHEADEIVLGCALAWRLFGSFDVVGLPVDVDSHYFTVSGVVRQGNDSAYMAWMPRQNAPANASVTALYMRAHHFNTLNVNIDVQALLQTHFFRNSLEYAVVDINRYVESIHYRNRLLFYLLWFCVLVILLCNLAGAVKTRQWSWVSIFAIGAGICAVVLFGVNDILQWIPNPALSDSSAFADFTNIGALPPSGYLTYAKQQFRTINQMANIVWLLGAIACINLLLTGKWVRL
ncbi:MAG: ABC transporter permease [Defluviitaleaceae bacterium]|nr:ABC transporter permease [Defluviitaleaceae bacterium]MCL2276054.1 ABC transporter permease [Defluviitaleaceae bacterium]